MSVLSWLQSFFTPTQTDKAQAAAVFEDSKRGAETLGSIADRISERMETLIKEDRSSIMKARQTRISLIKMRGGKKNKVEVFVDATRYGEES